MDAEAYLGYYAAGCVSNEDVFSKAWLNGDESVIGFCERTKIDYALVLAEVMASGGPERAKGFIERFRGELFGGEMFDGRVLVQALRMPDACYVEMVHGAALPSGRTLVYGNVLTSSQIIRGASPSSLAWLLRHGMPRGTLSGAMMERVFASLKWEQLERAYADCGDAMTIPTHVGGFALFHYCVREVGDGVPVGLFRYLLENTDPETHDRNDVMFGSTPLSVILTAGRPGLLGVALEAGFRLPGELEAGILGPPVFYSAYRERPEEAKAMIRQMYGHPDFDPHVNVAYGRGVDAATLLTLVLESGDREFALELMRNGARLADRHGSDELYRMIMDERAEYVNVIKAIPHVLQSSVYVRGGLAP